MPPDRLTSIMLNLKIIGMKRSWPVVLVVFLTSGCAAPQETATSVASPAEGTTRQTPSRVPGLRIRTYHGCESVPARGLLQRLFVGFEFTGASCSVAVVAVVAGNSVRVSFMDDDIVPLAPYPSPDGHFNSDILIGELDNSDVLIVQHDFNGHVRSVTQTIRDSIDALYLINKVATTNEKRNFPFKHFHHAVLASIGKKFHGLREASRILRCMGKSTPTEFSQLHIG